MRQQQEREEREGELAKRHINSSDCIERTRERERERALGVRAKEIYGFGAQRVLCANNKIEMGAYLWGENAFQQGIWRIRHSHE